MRDNLVIVPFQADHVKNMELMERDQWLNHNGNIFLFAQRHERLGVGYTVYYNATVPVACGGIDLMWDHVGEAWMLLSPYVNLYRVAVTRAVRNRLAYLTSRMELNRVQAVIRVTDKPSIRYIEMLGFEKEGILRQYGTDGTDYYMYGRVA